MKDYQALENRIGLMSEDEFNAKLFDLECRRKNTLAARIEKNLDTMDKRDINITYSESLRNSMYVRERKLMELEATRAAAAASMK